MALILFYKIKSHIVFVSIILINYTRVSIRIHSSNQMVLMEPLLDVILMRMVPSSLNRQHALVGNMKSFFLPIMS